jgi:preprotein translocase subunit SecE
LAVRGQPPADRAQVRQNIFGRARVAELIAGMFNTSRYKRSQGKMARQVTLTAMAVIVAVGAWKLSSMGQTYVTQEDSATAKAVKEYVMPLVVLAMSWWASFRIVNLPKFADFLISVEAEMNKVSWPERGELWRASLVVIIVIFFLAGLLFTYDFLLDRLMSFFGL